MFKWLGGLIDSNEKELDKIQPLVKKINELSPQFQILSDNELKNKTTEFKTSIAEATADKKHRLDVERQSLDEAREQSRNSADEYEREAAAFRIKELEKDVTQLEEETRKAEVEFLNKLIPEAFAAVKEAARRTIKQVHFDVQLIGGVVLHQGKIAEMRTGEGKTITATLPLYLNALTGRGCHLVTVNDFLVRYHANWMGPIYHALGISVSCIFSQTPDNPMPSFIFDPTFESNDSKHWHLKPVTRKQAYEADITYGTNNEFGFDYLRDNMVSDLSQRVQRTFDYAIVDEVDNLLIDEARTPLIISGAAEESGNLYKEVNSIVNRMKWKVQTQEPVTAQEKEADEALDTEYDFVAYEKNRGVKETPRGQEKLARSFGVSPETLFGGGDDDQSTRYTTEEAKKHHDILTIFRKAMAANALYKKDVDYVVKDGEVIIVDEFTGRLMYGRRYSEGLHQAIEAKEGVKVQRESLTYATITFQNYFRMYKKLAGMTGTALTEAEEFNKIYKLDVIVIPTNKPMIREDFTDRIYKSENGKYDAVVREVEEMNKQSRPVLIGTVSIEKSELLSEKLKRKGIKHEVLNAKYHEKEAGIIADAGKPGAVTVATNMAGRGVDIILGGKQPDETDEKSVHDWQDRHNQVVSAGGLHVIGTERHESRRIDNQLRGRAGRQGDPGSSRFFVSLEDDIMRRFGGDRIKTMMNWVGMDEDTPIEIGIISRTIADVQKRVEGYNFDIRKHLVEYDDVVNTQRELIYSERRKILSGADLKSNILDMISQEIKTEVPSHIDDHGIKRDETGLLKNISTIFPIPAEISNSSLSKLSRTEIEEKLIEAARIVYDQREKEFGSDMRLLERLVMLRIIDSLWVEHLTAMEEMRLGIGFQAVAQQDPLVAYKNSGHEQFQTLRYTIQRDIVHTIYHVSIKREQAAKPPPSAMAKAAGRENVNKKPVQSGNKKPGRNDPCPCGSGKKYKHCCGK
jgi:preprotein translocase subunit SecA